MAMHQDDRSHVTPHQAMSGQVTGQSHHIKFMDWFHHFGKGVIFLSGTLASWQFGNFMA
jgi:hypothetical protein